MKNISFREEEIRDKNLVKGQRTALLQDIGYLLSRADKFVKVNCPACNENDFSVKYIKHGFQYAQCEKCKTLYTNPRPDAKLLGEFYQQSQNYAYWNKYIFPASEEARREKIFKPRVNNILRVCEKYGISQKSLLEIGAGYGTFCLELMARNIFSRVVAIEPTPSLAETCRNKGIITIEKPIEQILISDQEKFDVIVNFEVIEHLFSPEDLIIQSKKFLKKNGLMVITCPNGLGFDVITLGQLSNTIDHEHINYFNPASLSLLLEKCGFEILEATTPGVLDADLVRNAVLEGKFDLEGQEFLKRLLIDDWDTMGSAFQRFLTENNMSSNMWIIAKNK